MKSDHDVEKWWSTAITETLPGEVRYRGYPVEEVIGRLSFVETTWLLLRGERPEPRAARLLEAALVAAVDHGPLSPSCAVARMAISCGVGVNGALGSAINLLGDSHGGAGEQCLAMLARIDEELGRSGGGGDGLSPIVQAALGAGARVPGYGKHLHPIDPRAAALCDLLDRGRRDGVVAGRFLDIAREIERQLERRKGRRIPLNIDGALAVTLGELGFSPPLARGLFIVARSVGLLAHIAEEQQSGRVNKGPLPPGLHFRYTGPAPRKLERP